ncbi:MAG: hypothetical protein ACE366_21855 [Bradymonadia bacterium]
METMFENSNQIFRDEMGYWNAQMLDLTQKSITEGEKIAATVRDNMTRALSQQTEFMFGMIKHNAELMERQVKAFGDAVAQAVPAKG